MKTKMTIWTKTALECYERNCNCTGCYYSTLETVCVMRETVEATLRECGEPNKPKPPKQSKHTEAIIDAIVNGAKNKYEVAQMCGMRVENVQSKLNKLCKNEIKNGHEFASARDRFGELAEILTERKQK